MDTAPLDAALSMWLAARVSTPSTALAPVRRMIATDGKTARGVRRTDGRAVHLLAAFDQASGVVLGQTVVEGKTKRSTPSPRSRLEASHEYRRTRCTPSIVTPITCVIVARTTCSG